MTKTHQKIFANWILDKQDIFKNVLPKIFNLFTDTSKNSAHFVILNTFIAKIIFLYFSYLQTDCTLLQLTICSLTLFLGHKTHLIFILCRFLAIRTNSKSFPFSKMIPHEIATIHACFHLWLLKVLWLTSSHVAAGYLKSITTLYLNSIICRPTSLIKHKIQTAKDFLSCFWGVNSPAECTTTPGTGFFQLVQAQQVSNQHSHLWWALISCPNQILILLLTETAVGGDVRVIPWDLKLTSAQRRAATWSQALLMFALLTPVLNCDCTPVWWQFLFKKDDMIICTKTSEGVLLSPGWKLTAPI